MLSVCPIVEDVSNDDDDRVFTACLGACSADFCFVLVPFLDTVSVDEDLVSSLDDFVSDSTLGLRDEAGLLRFKESLDREFLVCALSMSTSNGVNLRFI